jgi:putative membrane protein
MKRILIIGVSALALAACGGEAARNTASDAGNLATATESKMEDTAGAAVGMGGAMAANNTAADYVTNAALGDMYEIESSKLALEKAQSPEVKKFAQQMVTDHTATTKKLKDTVAQANLSLSPPAALDARRQGMIDNLKSASGADFDRAYLDQQTAAHREALTLHSGFAQDGDNDALKKLAAKTAPRIQHHLDMVKQLDSSGADGTR